MKQAEIKAHGNAFTVLPMEKQQHTHTHTENQKLSLPDSAIDVTWRPLLTRTLE